MTRPLAVLASRIRGEEKLLLAELDRRHVDYTVLDTRQLVFDCAEPDLPYRAAFAREISHHRALYAARLFEHAGVPTLNSASAIATCGDKLLTTLALTEVGVRTPRTMLALTPTAGLDALERLRYPAVVKPVTGSWGRLMARLSDRENAEAVLEHRDALPHPQHKITYLQEYVPSPGRDIRVLVAGEEIIGAVYRISSHWRTNAARDAVTRPCPVDDDLAGLVRAAVAAIGPGMYGVDVLEDRSGGYYVNEINHTPEFHGAALALDADIAARYVDYLLTRVGIR